MPKFKELEDELFSLEDKAEMESLTTKEKESSVILALSGDEKKQNLFKIEYERNKQRLLDSYLLIFKKG